MSCFALYYNQVMTEFEKIDDNWTLIKNACRNTVNKKYSEKEPSEQFKKNLLIAEHSPIRLFNTYWRWKDIKYWVSQEWARHKFEKFISTQRNDRQQKYDRNKTPQDSPVNMDCSANMQNLIDVWRKRLCFQATPEARTLAEDFKVELSKTNPIESSVLVPNCIYRCGCPEINKCGFFQGFTKYIEEQGYINSDLFDIQKRYDLYNEYFYLREFGLNKLLSRLEQPEEPLEMSTLVESMKEEARGGLKISE